MKIAMIGSRGVPATFGGIEHHVEEIGSRLAARGHEVVVYARTNYIEEPVDRFRGMRVKRLPTVNSKHLDAIAHSFVATIHAMRQGVDIVHYHAIGPGVPAVLPRFLSRAGVALTVHGRDGERAKWGRGARAILSAAEWESARVPNATIVVSRDLQRHFSEVHGRATDYIANGVDPPEPKIADEITRRWGLAAGSYLLFVGRLVPEKAPDLLIRAARRAPGDLRLVVAGGSSFTDNYVTALRSAAAGDPRIELAGYVYGDVLRELYTNARAFVLPSSLEGLPLTLLEAASYGTPVVASDIPPHVEIVGKDAPGHRLFRSGSEDELVAAIARSIADPDAERTGAVAFRDDVLRRFRWDEAAERTERVYERIVGGRRGRGDGPSPTTRGSQGR
jgi:glycosyltransferase involved in cell wall biosynthesis